MFIDAFSVSSKVDFLVGNDIEQKVYTDKKVLLSNGQAATEKRLGWVLGGKLPPIRNDRKPSSFLTPTLLRIEKRLLSAIRDLPANVITDNVENNSKNK